MAGTDLLAPTTRDVIFGGRVVLHQPARGHGYRVNADSLLLADFAGSAKRGTLFDLGAGVGSIALVLFARGLVSRAVLVDDDGVSCALAERNIAANGANATVIYGDVLDVAKERRGQASLVVCNPPYFTPASVRVRGHAAKARVGDLDRFVQAARVVLGRRGRACFVYPSSDVARLFAALRAVGLEPKRLRLVHPTMKAAARVAMVEASASKPGGLITLPPLFERDGPRYTREAAHALGL